MEQRIYQYTVRGSKITGVEGNPVGTDKGYTVPGNAQGVSKRTGKVVNIPLTFSSQQIRGRAPALLGLPAMIRAGAIINCRDNTMTMSIEGEDVVFDLVLTKSGHYILPLDSFQEKMVRKAEHKCGREI